jgi:hypothetical protein
MENSLKQKSKSPESRLPKLRVFQGLSIVKKQSSGEVKNMLSSERNEKFNEEVPIVKPNQF